MAYPRVVVDMTKTSDQYRARPFQSSGAVSGLERARDEQTFKVDRKKKSNSSGPDCGRQTKSISSSNPVRLNHSPGNVGRTFGSKSHYNIMNSPVIAIDCEMVGVGPKDQSALARCSIVDEGGRVVYDEYVKPTMWVKNYRTKWSGVTKKHLKHAVPHRIAVQDIHSILHGCLVVGHDVMNDFQCLGYNHPPELTRDTAQYHLLKNMTQTPKHSKPGLKKLAKVLLNKDIQRSHRGHSSVEDARTAMEIYQHVGSQWENELLNDAVFLNDEFWEDS